MRNEITKKILYAILSLFLVCNFFSTSPSDDCKSNSLDSSDSVASISVPHGIHMEIKSEERSSSSIIINKEKSTRNISYIRFLLLIIFSIIASHTLFCACVRVNNLSVCYSRLSIINYIHKKDGRKRR